MVQIYEIGLNQAGRSQGATGTQIESQGQWTTINVLINKVGGSGEAERKRITNFDGQTQSDSYQKGSGSGLSVSTLLASSIALPLPTELTQQFQQEWSVEETGMVQQGIAEAGRSAMNSSGISDFLGRIVGSQNLLGIAKNEIIQRANNVGFKKAIQENGIAFNPFREIFYNGVIFRQFQYSWDFAPVSKKEADTIEQLIYDLTYHAHPEFLDDAELAPFIIPDTFELEFVNTKIPKMKALALTDINVSYSNSGAGPKFFNDGHAAFLQLQLSFTETTPLTKDKIMELRNNS